MASFASKASRPRLILPWPCVHHLQDRKPPGCSCVYDHHWSNRRWGQAALTTRCHWLALDHVYLKKLCSPLKMLFFTVFSHLISIARCSVVTSGTQTWMNTTFMFISEAFKCYWSSVLGTYSQLDLGSPQLPSSTFLITKVHGFSFHRNEGLTHLTPAHSPEGHTAAQWDP